MYRSVTTQSQPSHRGRVSMRVLGELNPSFADDFDESASDVSYSSTVMQEEDDHHFCVDEYSFIEGKRADQRQRQMDSDYAQQVLEYRVALAEQRLADFVPPAIQVPTDSSVSSIEPMPSVKKKSDKKKKKSKVGKKMKATKMTDGKLDTGSASKSLSKTDVVVSGATESSDSSDLTTTDSSNSDDSSGKGSTYVTQKERRSFNRGSLGLTRVERMVAPHIQTRPASMPFLYAKSAVQTTQRKAVSSRRLSMAVKQVRDVQPDHTPGSTVVYPRMIVKISKLPGDFIGLTLWRNGPDLYVQGIANSSTFEDTNLAPGQQIFAVNGISCTNANPQKVLDFLNHSVGILALVVSREITSPVYTITKLKEPGKSCGIQLRRRRKSGGCVSIAKISPRGPFAEAELVGMPVLFINGSSCQGKSAREAGRYLSRALRSVSITVAKPRVPTAHRHSIKLFSLQPQLMTCPMCGYQGSTRTRLQRQELSATRRVTSCFVRALSGFEMPTVSTNHYCPRCAEFLGTFKGMTV